MKYIGSKQKIAKDIVPIIESYLTDKTEYYIEPFVGGANVIDKINFDRKIGYDIDRLVIDLYNATQYAPQLLDNMPQEVSREYYYQVRDDENKFAHWYRSAILLFASYNARVYGGCYGAMAKTKDGGIRNYYQEALRNYQKQLPNLKGIIFEQKDYRELKAKNCVIYCDPPYKASLHDYKTPFNHDEFWQWVREQSKDNTVLVSEYEAPSDMTCIWQKEVKTHLDNKNKINKVEKLFIYKGENEGVR